MSLRGSQMESGRAPEPAGKVLEPAGRALEPAGWASEPARRRKKGRSVPSMWWTTTGGTIRHRPLRSRCPKNELFNIGLSHRQTEGRTNERTKGRTNGRTCVRSDIRTCGHKFSLVTQIGNLSSNLSECRGHRLHWRVPTTPKNLANCLNPSSHPRPSNFPTSQVNCRHLSSVICHLSSLNVRSG